MKTLTKNFNFQLRTFVLTAEESLLKKKNSYRSLWYVFVAFLFSLLWSRHQGHFQKILCVSTMKNKQYC